MCASGCVAAQMHHFPEPSQDNHVHASCHSVSSSKQTCRNELSGRRQEGRNRCCSHPGLNTTVILDWAPGPFLGETKLTGSRLGDPLGYDGDLWGLQGTELLVPSSTDPALKHGHVLTSYQGEAWYCPQLPRMETGRPRLHRISFFCAFWGALATHSDGSPGGQGQAGTWSR